MAECRQKPEVSTGKQLLPFSTTSPRMFTLIWATKERLMAIGKAEAPPVGCTCLPTRLDSFYCTLSKTGLGVGRKSPEQALGKYTG